MATITPTGSTNVDSLSWASLDGLVINNGYTITVNTSQEKAWGGITINNGKLRIENTSTTTPLIFRMTRGSGTTAPAITPASGLGSIEIDGDWIEIGTGDGTANQTFTLPFNDHCAAIWVETAPSSGVYRPWSNILRRVPRSGVEWDMEGWDAWGNGIRGYVFKQTPNASPVYHSVQTNCTTSTSSKNVTVTSTAGIFPGAQIVGSAGITANSVVQRVIDGTTLEMQANGTANSSTVTVTIYNTQECWTSNQVVFGDGTNGNVVPNGCKVRVPNIVITGAVGMNIATGNSGVNINLTNGGILTADTCLFANSQNTFTTPQSLSLSHVGFTHHHGITKCYGVTMNDVLFSVPIMYPYLTAGRELENYQASQMNWTYLKGTITNLYHYSNSGYISGSLNDSHNFLTFQYCEGMTIENMHLQIPLHTYLGMLGLYFCNRNTLNNITLIGSTRFMNLYSSNENQISNVTYGVCGYKENISPPQNGTGWNMFAHLPNGDRLTNGTTYYIKHLRKHVYLPSAPYLESTWTHAVVPYKATSPYMVQEFRAYVTGATQVVLLWDDRRNSVSPSPCYAIFRSTTEGCPVRDGTTQITTQTTAVVTYTDNTPVTGTTYWYVLRKYLSVDLLTYEDTPAIECTPVAQNVYTNYLLQSLVYNNAQWVKSVSPTVTIASSADISCPMQTALGAVFYNTRRAQVVNANATITNTVTGLVSGTTYTASIWLRFTGRCDNAVAEVTTTPCLLTFGSASQAITVTNEWQRFSVSDSSAATSRNFVLRFDTAGNWVDLGNAQVNLGATATADIGTTTAAVTNAVFAAVAAGAWSSFTDSDTAAIAGIYMPTEVLGAGWQQWLTYIGTTRDFTPSASNLLIGEAIGASTLKVSTSSSRNRFTNITQSGVGDRLYFLECTLSSSDNIFENLTYDSSGGHYYTSGVPYGCAAYLISDANRNLLKNWDTGVMFEYSVYSKPIYTDNTCNDNVLENVRNKRGALNINPDNNGMLLKGCFGGYSQAADTYYYNPALMPMADGNTGVDLTFTGIYNTHFSELYHTETTGAMHLWFTASTSETPPYVLTGTASFSNTGRLYLQTPGDSATYTWPHKIYGVSGFRNLEPIWYTNDLSYNNTAGQGREMAQSILFEFQIDTGSGWSAWTEATAANLSALSVSASDGFYLKLRLTARQFVIYTGEAIAFQVNDIIRQQTSGATARVTAVYDMGTSGLLCVDNVSATWTPTSTLDILRDSDSAVMATGISLVNTSFAMGPSFNSYVQGLQVFTNVDQTVVYPSDPITLTITGIEAGSDVTFLEAGTENVLLNLEDIGGTSAEYVYYTASGAVDINIYKAGFMPHTTIRNYTLPSTDSSVPIKQSPDLSYLE